MMDVNITVELSCDAQATVALVMSIPYPSSKFLTSVLPLSLYTVILTKLPDTAVMSLRKHQGNGIIHDVVFAMIAAVFNAYIAFPLVH